MQQANSGDVQQRNVHYPNPKMQERPYQRHGARSLNGGGDIIQRFHVLVFDKYVMGVEYLSRGRRWTVCMRLRGRP